MELIKEPAEVDLMVGPSRLTDEDRRAIDEIILDYKRTGKLPAMADKPSKKARQKNMRKFVGSEKK